MANKPNYYDRKFYVSITDSLTHNTHAQQHANARELTRTNRRHTATVYRLHFVEMWLFCEHRKKIQWKNKITEENCSLDVFIKSLAFTWVHQMRASGEEIKNSKYANTHWPTVWHMLQMQPYYQNCRLRHTITYTPKWEKSKQTHRLQNYFRFGIFFFWRAM